MVGLNRSLFYYHQNKPRLKSDKDLVDKIKVIKKSHPVLGAKKIARMISTNENKVNHKRIARLLKENDLFVKKKRRKRSKIYELEHLPIPMKSNFNNEIWSIDFMCARKSNAFRFMLLNIIDISSRLCPGMVIERSFTSFDVTQELEKSIKTYGKPQGIITDNGAEFTSTHFRIWCKRNNIIHYLTKKGTPSENSYVESFNSSVRREILDANDFISMNSLRRKIANWRDFYNEERPHGSLGYLSPEKYLKMAINRK